jgi:glutathione S-transferase
VNPVLRIFSYLPNPRVWKSVITANISGVEIELIGDKPKNLSSWLWDYDAREMNPEELAEDSPHLRKGKRGFSGALYKTDSFLISHPFGTVPAAFSPEGKVGVFESNSIMRSIARSGNHNSLYGRNGFDASRIDSFLDANLIFSREAQVYLLEIEDLNSTKYERMHSSYNFYMSGIEASLNNGAFIAGEDLSLADISFVCDVSQFLREGHYEDSIRIQGFDLITNKFMEEYPAAAKHLLKLSNTEDFLSVMGSYLDWFKKKIKN